MPFLEPALARPRRRRSASVRLFSSAMLVVVFAMACATDDDNMFDVRTLEDASLTDSGPPPQPNDSCVPEFCPALGSGVPCCITTEGPCGIDTGLGCQEFSPPSPQGDQ